MDFVGQERRRYERYDTQAKIYFHVTYNIKAKVEFQVVNKHKERDLSKTYPGLVMNISVEGMRFSSDKKLKDGDNLYLEVYLPRQQEPICMTG